MCPYKFLCVRGVGVRWMLGERVSGFGWVLTSFKFSPLLNHSFLFCPSYLCCFLISFSFCFGLLFLFLFWRLPGADTCVLLGTVIEYSQLHGSVKWKRRPHIPPISNCSQLRIWNKFDSWILQNILTCECSSFIDAGLHKDRQRTESIESPQMVSETKTKVNFRRVMEKIKVQPNQI